MIGLLNYYRIKNNEDDEIVFQRVKEEDITICGKTIEEVIRILKGLDFERVTQIEMTMKNLEKYYEFIRKEQEELIEESFNRLKNQFKVED